MTGVPASAAGGPSPAGATGKVSAVGTTGKANPTGASKAGAARPAGADQGAEGDARPHDEQHAGQKRVLQDHDGKQADDREEVAPETDGEKVHHLPGSAGI